MANFLDRRALKKILDVATAIRRADTAPADEAAVAYVVRGQKSPARQIRALRALHAASVAAFGGHVGRETADGLVAVFAAPLDAVRAGLHAIHADDLSSEFLTIPDCRVAVARGPVSSVEGPDHYRDATGAAVDRAAHIVGRADAGGVVVEESLFAQLRSQIEGYGDVEIAPAKKGRIPGLSMVTTFSIKPLGLRPEREREYIDVDEELRARPRR